MRLAGLARWVAIVLAAASVAGCSAYTAARDESQGGLQPDGSYALTDKELSQNCRGLQAWIEGYVDATRKLEYQRSEKQLEPARSVLTGLSRMNGETVMDGTTRSLCSNYARMVAMNGELQRRKCKTFDFVAALAVPDPRSGSSRRVTPNRHIWGVEKETGNEYRHHPANAAGTMQICGIHPVQAKRGDAP